MINPRRWWLGLKHTALASLAVMLVSSVALPALSGRPPALKINHAHLVIAGGKADLYDHNHDEPAEPGADGVISLFEYPGLQELSPILGGHLALPTLSLLPFLLGSIFWLFRLQRYRPAVIFLPRWDRPPLP